VIKHGYPILKEIVMEASDLARVEAIVDRVTIDPNNLERECSEQAAMFEEAGELSSSAKTELSAAEMTCDVTKARVELDIRKNPSNYDLGKVTEGSVKAALILNVDVQHAEQVVADATSTYLRIRTLIGALDQRRSMVSGLVSLYVHNYYVSGEFESGSDKRRVLTEDERIDLTRRIVESRSN